MSADDDSLGFRHVLIFVDLVHLDEDGDDLPISERMWRPRIVFTQAEDDTETKLERESTVDFTTFSEAFAWLFHEMALACLELEFAGPAPPLTSRFPERLPDLPLSVNTDVRQVFAGLTCASQALNGWSVFVDVHRMGDEETDLDGPAFGTDVADAFRILCNWAEASIVSSTPTASSYPRSDAVFTGGELNQTPDGPLEGLSFVEPETIFSDERALEEHLAKNPDQLYDDFWLVGRQLSVGAKKADLVGIDGRGALVVVELKHGSPDREALAQVIEYAGFLSHLPFAKLARHLSSQSASPEFEPSADFASEYRERFGAVPSSGVPVRPALVSTQIDEYAARSITYLRASGVPLDFFVIDAVDGPKGPAIWVNRNPSLTLPTRWYAPPDLKRGERIEWILEEAQHLAIWPVYQQLYEVIDECLQPYGSWVPREDSDSLGLCRSLSSRSPDGKTRHRECIVIRVWGHRPDQVWMFVFDELVNFAPRKTKAFLKSVEHRRDGIPGKTKGYSFSMTKADWDRHGDEFRELLGYMGKRWREREAGRR